MRQPAALTQGGLFEPEPPRRVTAPGAEGWWGVDPSTRHYVVATVDRALVRRVHRCLLGDAGPSNGERLTRYARQLRELIKAMLAEGCPRPGAVWVEQTSGEHPNPELMYATAVCVQVTYETLDAELGSPVMVETVPVKTWKSKLAPGAGAWDKTHRVEGRKTRRPVPTLEYKVLQWARVNGYAGEDWDDADALGIAEGLRKTVALLDVAGPGF